MLKPREQLSEQELKEALDSCAREPIHIPGSIQPHGMLIGVDDDLIIRQISENSARFIGTEAADCLDRPLSDFFAAEDIAKLHVVASRGALQPIQSTVFTVKDKRFDVAAHHSDGILVIEFELFADVRRQQDDFYYDELRDFAVKMHSSNSLQDIFDHVTSSVRQLTNIDRVKLYRFDPDWNGEVVAESKADYMPSYKGLHFPASDIPPQARRLYTQSYLRLIVDTAYQPVPLIAHSTGNATSPLDMSLAMLRSVSPVHIQYLENMRVRASMSVSIIQNGKLWGLIACHHNSPLHIPYPMRMVAEIMGHIFSAQLSTMENHARIEAQDKREKLVSTMTVSLEQNFLLSQLLDTTHKLTMEAMEAEGLAVKTFVSVLKYGNCPDEGSLAALFDWLKKHQGDKPFWTADAEASFAGAPGLERVKGGLLAMPISHKSHNYIVWFRRPMISSVQWAGNPEKPLEETMAGYRLTPRSSFELWREQVTSKSDYWTDDDVRTARRVTTIILESEKMSAEQANLAKTEFLANMSHEIRTPMNAVIGLTRILLNSSPLTPKQKDYLNTLQISADGLLALINDLLDISKIETQSFELEAIPFSLSRLIQEVISMMSVKAAEKGIAFTIDERIIENRVFLGDPGRIRQILLNLCTNAVKFTEKGTVSIVIHSEATNRVGVEQICVSVSDTGIGIPEDKLETIFHKFVQADASISRKYGGTGLGLAITKMLAEAMGGHVAVKSEPGIGSTFTACFDLSVAEEEAPASDEGTLQNTETSGAAKPKVLLVEDYEANVLVAGTYLEMFGYDYEVASSGIESVEKAKANHYDVILMDVQMPGMNGLEATQFIREHEAKTDGKRRPIIGMTAHALAGDRERCLGAGMDEYISKPINAHELKGKLAMFTAVDCEECKV